MAFKIPESPNIIGGQAVLRQPSNIQGTTVTPDFSVDTRAAQEALGAVSEAAAAYAAEKTSLYLGDFKVKYTQFMTNERDKTFDKYTGENAHDLYENYLRKASDKFIEKTFTPSVDNADKVISNKHLQKQFKQWVDSQQSTYIAQAASHEARELEAWRKSVWDSQDYQAASLIMSAKTDIEIANGIKAFYTTAQDMLPGLDPNYVSQVAAKKADDAVAGWVEQQLIADPVGAFDAMMDKAVISDALTGSTKRDLIEQIQKSYIDKASKEYSYYHYSGGAQGTEPKREDIIKVFMTSNEAEIEDIIDNIKRTGRKSSEARAKETAGLITASRTAAANKFRLATSDEERMEAIENLYEVDPQSAIDIQNSYEEDLYNQAMIVKYSELKDRLPEDVTQEQLSSGWAALGLTPAEVEVIEDYNRMSQERMQYAPEYIEIMTGLSSGAIAGYDARTMGHLPPDMKMAIINTSATQGEYREIARQMSEIHGINIDSMIKDYEPRLDRLDIGAVNTMKRSIIEGIAKYKAHNKDFPVGDALRDIVLKAQQTALSPDASALQEALQEASRSPDFDELDFDAEDSVLYLAATTFGKVKSGDYSSTVSSNTLDKTEKRARRLVNSFAKKLPLKKREWVTQHVDSLVPLVVGGDYRTIVALVQGVI